MDISLFIQLVNGIGFPIACVVALGVYIVWDKKNTGKLLRELTSAVQDLSIVKEGYADLKSAVENLNQLILKILEGRKEV